MFCPECGSILIPKEKSGKKILACSSCDYSKDPKGENVEIKEKIEAGKIIEVMDEEKSNLLPKIRSECRKCENDIAYYWTRQTRSADEPETRFFKCTKCNYTWREYS